MSECVTAHDNLAMT